MPEITLPDVDPFFKVNDWGDALTTGETLKMVHTGCADDQLQKGPGISENPAYLPYLQPVDGRPVRTA